MQDDQTSAAIKAAIDCDWETAVQANSTILKNCPEDIDCLNRLGKALLELGATKKAIVCFRKVLKIDKYNQIAQKNLLRSATSRPGKKVGSLGKTNSHVVNFLEEPGKTKLVTLVNIAPSSVLLKQNYADNLNLLSKRHTVVVEDPDGNYLGALPDDLGHRLSILIKGGNRYEAITKSVCRNAITILLRETSRSKKFHDTPSFLSTTSADYLSSLREDSAPSGQDGQAASSEDADDSADDEIGGSAKHHFDEEPEAS